MAGVEDALTGLRFGVLTCSSTRTPADDLSGDALEAGVRAAAGQVVVRSLVGDDRRRIADLLQSWVASGSVDVILTTGGTGLGPDDVTPEATLDVGERDVPGVAELLRLRGLEKTAFAALSRGRAAIRGTTLIVNLPGSPAGARDGLSALLPVLPHAIAMLCGAGHPR